MLETLRRLGPPVAAAERQLGQAVMGAVLLASVLALAGPAFSLQSDLEILRVLLHERIRDDASLDADALQRRLSVVIADLERLARRVASPPPDMDVDALMQRFVQEQAQPPPPSREGMVKDEESAGLFDRGVTVLGVDGQVVATSSPARASAMAAMVAEGRRNFTFDQRFTILPLEGQGVGALAVAVPVRVDGKLQGLVVGAFALDKVWPDESAASREVYLVDARANPVVPAAFPEPLDVEAPRVLAAERAASAHAIEHGTSVMAAASVNVAGLHVILRADEQVVVGPMKSRALIQMALLILFQGAAVVLLATFLRISYQRFLALERRLTEETRMASLGAASSLIAHEVKNSLNGLQAACSMLPRGGESEVPVKVIRGQVDRLQYLARSLLSFGKPTAAHVQSMDVSTLIHEVMEGVALVPEAEDVVVDADVPGDVMLETDPLLLTTALHNLLRNAVEAAASAKDVGRQPAPRVRVRLVPEAAQVRIDVEDNAGGVPPEVLGRLFEPFVTSKPKGIGLGLSVSRQAVAAQGGRLVHEPIEGGSRFSLLLPWRKA